MGGEYIPSSGAGGRQMSGALDLLNDEDFPAAQSAYASGARQARAHALEPRWHSGTALDAEMADCAPAGMLVSDETFQAHGAPFEIEPRGAFLAVAGKRAHENDASPLPSKRMATAMRASVPMPLAETFKMGNTIVQGGADAEIAQLGCQDRDPHHGGRLAMKC